MRIVEDSIRRIVRSMANVDGSGILDVKRAFKFFDSNESGSVTTREFKRALRKLGFKLKQAELSELITTLIKTTMA